jgi:hypothetical protein
MPVVTNCRISSAVRKVSMMIVGGGERGGDRSNPLPEYKESEEIQCPNIILTEVNSLPFHVTVFCHKLIGEFEQFSGDPGMVPWHCAVAGIHVGLESKKAVAVGDHDGVV